MTPVRAAAARAAALALGLGIAAALPAAAQDVERGAPAPIAPFDRDACRALSNDPARTPAQRIEALVALLDDRLAAWSRVAAGKAAAVEGRDDRGQEIFQAVANIAGNFQREAAAGRAKPGVPVLADFLAGRTLLEPAAVADWWAAATLLGGTRRDVPPEVLSLLDRETDGTLLAALLQALSDRCPPAAVPAVLRLLAHPLALRSPNPRNPWTFPVRLRAARVLASLGVKVETSVREDPAAAHPDTVHAADQEDLAALCRKWLRSEVEEEWKGALAIVRAVGKGPCVSVLSMEMAEKGVPLPKLEAMSATMEAVQKAAPAGGK